MDIITQLNRPYRYPYPKILDGHIPSTLVLKPNTPLASVEIRFLWWSSNLRETFFKIISSIFLEIRLKRSSMHCALVYLNR